jgi:hypothetical protein
MVLALPKLNKTVLVMPLFYTLELRTSGAKLNWGVLPRNKNFQDGIMTSPLLDCEKRMIISEKRVPVLKLLVH